MANGFGLTDLSAGPSEGIGLLQKSPAISQVPREVDTTRAAAAKTARPKSVIPSFTENPLGAIGLILSETARGIKGQPSGIPELERAAIEQQGLQFRMLDARFKAIKIGQEQLKKFSSREDKERFIVDFDKQTVGLDVGPILRGFADADQKTSDAAIKYLNDNQETLPLLNSLVQKGLVRPEDVAEFVTDLAKLTAKKRIEREFEKPGDLVNLKGPSGDIVSARINSSAVDDLLKAGFVEVPKKPAVAPVSPQIVQLQKAAEDARTANKPELAKQIEARIKKITTVVGTTPQDPSAINKNKPLINNEIQFRTSSLNALGGTKRLREQLASDKTFTGFTSKVVRGLSSLAGTMIQASAALGFDEEGLLNPGQYNLGGFGGDAAASAGFQSNVINLAYVLARAAEPEARQLSNSDVQKQLEVMSAGSGDKGQILASLDEVDRGIKRRAVARDKVVRSFVTGLPPLPKELSGDAELTPEEEAVAAAMRRGATKEEVRRLLAISDAGKK